MTFRLRSQWFMGLAVMSLSGCLYSSVPATRLSSTAPRLARPKGPLPIEVRREPEMVAAGYRPEMLPMPADSANGYRTTSKPFGPLTWGAVSAGGVPYANTDNLDAPSEATPELVSSRWEPPQDPHRAAEFPEEIRKEPWLVGVIRCYLEHRPDDAAPEFAHIDEPSRQVLMTLLPLTVRAAEGQLMESGPKEIAQYVNGLQFVLSQLRPRAALTMEKVCFCRMIRGFGKIEALGAKPSFLPGEMADVYLELRNVASRPHRTEQGDYRTHLRSRLEIRNFAGERVWGPQEFDKPDDTLTPQHDYYQHYRLQMPSLPAGNYTLLLEVRDVPTGRQTSEALEFTVAPWGKTGRSN